MQQPISEWSIDVAANKLSELLGKAYKGTLMSGQELLQQLPEAEKERQKLFNCGLSELWKINDLLLAESSREQETLQQFELDLTVPPMLPEESNAQRAKEYGVDLEMSAAERSARRMVSEIFRSESIDMGESETIEVPTMQAPMPPLSRASQAKAEEPDEDEDEEEDS